MHIVLSPQWRTEPLQVTKQGDVLTINGEAFDFSSLPEGAEIADVPSEFVVCAAEHPVERVGGKIFIALIRPYGAKSPAADARSLVLEDAADGVIINYDGEKHVAA
ncbi:MAG: hypothetical protein K5863_00080 [Nitratireductor sp.]|uniref:hypothetical protein n=1 Tax=Nitratireductor sp. TaxID=1872084 RepID=UPI002617958F|nr:hypothetical protein [Nitratireductor sp.]MCV0348445.1 hypothetical protein [Nitratireductor sp.]